MQFNILDSATAGRYKFVDRRLFCKGFPKSLELLARDYPFSGKSAICSELAEWEDDIMVRLVDLYMCDNGRMRS